MDIIQSLLILAISLLVLIKGSDFFIESVEKIGLKFGISSYILGITVVAMGTSLPEMASSIFAVLMHKPEIVLGNVVGSNITNILLIVGVIAVFSSNVKLDRSMLTIDLPLLIISAMFMFFAFRDGEFSYAETCVFIIGLVVFLWSSFTRGKVAIEEKTTKIGILDFIKFIGGGVGVYFGSEYTIIGISDLAISLQVGSDVIAITLVALGTSLPELVVSIGALRKGNAEMAVGNVLGSNIFNTYGVTSIASLFGVIPVNTEMGSFGIPFMLGVTFVFGIMSISRSLSRWEGIMLLLMYVFFIDQAI